MKLTRGKIVLRIIVAIMTIGLMTACSSSRKFARDPIYDAGKTHAKVTKKQEHKTSKKKSSKTDASSSALVSEAQRWLGTRYVYGGHSKSGTDCSGFIMEVYRNAADIKLPRTTADQRDFCHKIDYNKLDAGDLVFFTSRNGKGKVSHVGMYIGDGKMIHASSSRGVIISSLDEKYYVTNYHSSGRVANLKKIPEPKTDNQSVPRPKPAAEISFDQLDEILSQKLDSIYSDMLD